MRELRALAAPAADLAGPAARAGAGARLAATMMTASTIQFTVGALAPQIVHDERLNAAGLGILISCYYLVAGMSSTWMGRLVGRTGGAEGLRLVAMLTLCGCLTIAFAPSLWGLAAGLLLASLAVAAANPATNLAISQMPPPHGVLIGVKQSGFQLAAIVAGSVMPFVAGLAGWRSSFGAGVALSSLVLLSLLRFERKATRPAVTAKATTRMLSADVAGFAAYAFFMGAGTANANVYLVLFASQRVDFSPQLAGGLVVVLGIASVAARIGWNVLLEHPPHRGLTQRAVLVSQALVAVVATAAISLAQFWGSGLIWAGAAALGLTAYAWNGVVNRGLVVLGGGDAKLGRDSGRVQGGFFFGLAAGPAVFGWLLHSTGSYVAGWSWSTIAFALALGVSSKMPAPRSGTNGDPN